jgi:hypothetical protein
MLWLEKSDSHKITKNVESSLEFGQVQSVDPSTTDPVTKKTPSPQDLKNEVWEQCEEDNCQANFQAAAKQGKQILMGTHLSALSNLYYDTVLQLQTCPLEPSINIYL